MKIDTYHARDAIEQTPNYWTLPATVMGNVAVAMIVALGVTPPVLRALDPDVTAGAWSWAALSAVALAAFALASATTQFVRSRRPRS